MSLGDLLIKSFNYGSSIKVKVIKYICGLQVSGHCEKGSVVGYSAFPLTVINLPRLY